MGFWLVKHGVVCYDHEGETDSCYGEPDPLLDEWFVESVYHEENSNNQTQSNEYVVCDTWFTSDIGVSCTDESDDISDICTTDQSCNNSDEDIFMFFV